MTADAADALHVRVRCARREAGLTQAALAAKAECKQSAISMFEAGRKDALSRDKVQRLAEILGMDSAIGESGGEPGTGEVLLKYCPVDECPSNVPYVVRGNLCFMPSLMRKRSGATDFCPWCGELLMDACPNAACAAPVAQGAFCRSCGTAYVTSTRREGDDVRDWARTQRLTILQVTDLAEIHAVKHGEVS